MGALALEFFSTKIFTNNMIAEDEWSNVVAAKCTREKLEGSMPTVSN
jgi:hypothetical protein